MATKRTIDSFFRKPAKKQQLEPVAAAAAQTPAPTSSAGDSGEAASLTVEQRRRAQLHKDAAMAKRALVQAAELVSAAAAKGLTVSFQQLLFEPGWATALQAEVAKPYWPKLEAFVQKERAGKAAVFPPPEHVFRAFNTCAFHRVRVVILGQDPYHAPGQAMGLCFSVPRGTKVPGSLNNMYKELHTDLGVPKPTHGDLHAWAAQGVLLLNTALTVRAHTANSHANQGWELLTDAAIRAVSRERHGVVFLLWGNAAKKKASLIDSTRHTVLTAAHPSGLSASRGFFGCKHFSQTNAALTSRSLEPIVWQLDA